MSSIDALPLDVLWIILECFLSDHEKTTWGGSSGIYSGRLVAYSERKSKKRQYVVHRLLLPA
jgi:hypothetical protein